MQEMLLDATKKRKKFDYYTNSERVHPICVAPLNDARECMFKADGNLLSCRDYID